MRELYFENHHIDCIGKGENKYTLYVADKSDPQLTVLGYMQYTALDAGYNELYVDYVEVKEELRGQGIGKALYRQLYELNQSYQFARASFYSESGRHIRMWFEEEVLNKNQKNGRCEISRYDV